MGTHQRPFLRTATSLAAGLLALALLPFGALPTVPAAVAAPADLMTAQNDWDGDGDADVVAAAPSGALHLYPGDGASGFGSRVAIGTGWQRRDSIRMVGDFDGRGATDILARDPSTGSLWLYPGTGTGGFGAALRVGTGWLVFSEIVAPGDWDGDGHPDVLAVRALDGTLWLYPGNGASGWRPARQVGKGWQTRDLLTPVGDWDGDGPADLVARDPRTGALWLYSGNGAGAFTAARAIGSGWQSFTALLGPGDWSGDGRSDLLARSCSGTLVQYAGNGVGGFLPRPYPTVGTGWTGVVLTWAVPMAAPVPAALAGQDWTRLPTSARVVALTFDMGANDAGLASILSTLGATGTPATFFATGDFARAHPVQVACLAATGYPVGNHSNTHPHYPLLTNTQIRADLWAAEVAITNPGAPTARPLFRFPFGDRTSADIAVVNGAGYVPVRWTVDSLGWKGTEDGGTVAKVVDRVVAAAVPGGIVLMHVGSNPDDHTTFDAAALPTIIQRLRAAGYGFVTLEPYFG